MQGLKVFELDERAVAYLRQRVDHLRSYAPSLEEVCSALDEVLRNKTGRVTTIAPCEGPIERLYEFEAGGLVPENLDLSRATTLDDGSTMMPIATVCDEEEELASLLRSDPNLVCLVVEPLPRRSDSGPKHLSTTFCVGEEVYQLITPETPADDFALAFYACPFWCNLNIVSGTRPFIDAVHNSTSAELRKCASAAIEVWCGAYDGEGCLRWRRD